MMIYLVKKALRAINGGQGGYPEAASRQYAQGLAARAYREQWKATPVAETVEAFTPIVLAMMRRSGMFKAKRSKDCDRIATTHDVAVWNKAAIAMLTIFMRRLPKKIGIDATVIEVEAWSLADNPYRLIEDLALALGRRSGDIMRVMPGWCQTVYTRLDKLRDVEAEELPKRDAFPRHWKQKPAELIDLIFRGTPFVELLSTPMPITIPDKALHCQAHGMAGVGAGKTTVNSAIILSNLGRKGMFVVDSKGGLADDLVKYSGRPDLIVKIDMTDAAMRPLFDVAQPPPGVSADRAAATIAFILSGMGIHFTDLQFPTFEMVTRIASKHQCPTASTLLSVMDNADYAAFLAEQADADTRNWFQTQYHRDETQLQLSQIARKLWGLKTSSLKKELLCGGRNTLRLAELLNQRKLVIFTMDKDKVGGDVSLITRLGLAAVNGAMWSRPPTPPDSDPDWLIVVDEYGDTKGDTSDGVIFDIVTQGRQRRVCLLITHQQIDGQLTKRVEGALLGNAAVKFACNVDNTDASKLAGVMNCKAGDLQGIACGDDGYGRFVFYIQGYIRNGALARVPFGHLQRRPGLNRSEFKSTVDGFRTYWAEVNAPSKEQAKEEGVPKEAQAEILARGSGGGLGENVIEIERGAPACVASWRRRKEHMTHE